MLIHDARPNFSMNLVKKLLTKQKTLLLFRMHIQDALKENLIKKMFLIEKISL